MMNSARKGRSASGESAGLASAGGNRSGASRRRFLQKSALLAAPALLGAATLPGAEPERGARPEPLRVVCVGGHPDDPESGCAGTLARYAEAGHSVTVLYLTRGERGIAGKNLEEAARIRSAECEEACRILGGRALFVGQIDGATEANAARVADLQKILAAEKPDVLLTQWPIDTHLDHQVASFLSMRVYLGLNPKPKFYFYEVNTGSQTHGFTPNVYVDITPVLEKKKAALFAHKSQNGDGIWKEHHEIIARFRGREAGVRAAEAFFHLNRNLRPDNLLPG